MRLVGSHINAYFPHYVQRSPEAIRARLENALGGPRDDMEAVRNRGQFSMGGGGWSLWCDEGMVAGEGPCGLSISVYPAIVEFTSVERFGAIERTDQGIHTALRRVFEAVAIGLGGGGQLAVAAGGFGDTDRARDLASAGAEFLEVCNCLKVVMGTPARSWEGLEAGTGNWYLRAHDAEPATNGDA